MIQRLPNCLHFCLLCSVVVLVISSFISGRAGDVGSLDLRSSRALNFSNISVGTGSVLIRCRPEGMWCDAALRIMVRKIFLAVSRKASFAQRVFNLSTVSVPVCLFRLMLVRCCIGVIVTSICKLMRIGRWSEPRFVFVCQLVEVIREADANETSGELGLALPGKSCWRIPV